MKKSILAISAIGILVAVILCLFVFLALGYYLFIRGTKEIMYESKRFWLEEQAKFLNKAAKTIFQENMDDLKTTIEKRILNIGNNKEQLIEQFGSDVDIWWDELQFDYGILSQLKQYGHQESLRVINDRCISLRIRILQCLPLPKHKIKFGEDKIPHYFYYSSDISESGKSIKYPHPHSNVIAIKEKDNYILQISKEIPPRVFFWQDGSGISYFISEKQPPIEFLNEVKQFYSTSDWFELDYDLFFPQMSDLKSNGWYEASGKHELWTSYWIKKEIGVINVNYLFYATENVGCVVILYSKNPELLRIPTKFEDWLQTSSDKDKCYFFVLKINEKEIKEKRRQPDQQDAGRGQNQVYQ